MQQSNSSTRITTRIILAIVFTLATLGCMFIGMQIAGGIFLGYLMSHGNETVLHLDPNPDKTIVVHVISDSCGATCDCTTRLDIEFGQEYKKGIYRISDCDVKIQWLDRYKFEVTDLEGNKTLLDTRDFGNMP